MKWADEFCAKAKAAGLECDIANRVNGWPETMIISGRRCYTKSMSYMNKDRLYFQGVDPKKPDEEGDYVILCGGATGTLRDIFIIPCGNFFQTLVAGEAVNTYKPPKEYLQFKFRIRDRDNKWIMAVQGRECPMLDVNRWRYSVKDAIEKLCGI